MSIPYREWAHANCRFLAARGYNAAANTWITYDKWDDTNYSPTLKVGRLRSGNDVWTVNVRPDGALVSGANVGAYAKIAFTVTLDTNDPSLTTFRLMKGPCYHSTAWDTGDGTGRFYDGINQWSSYPIYDLSSYSNNQYCNSPDDIVISTMPRAYIAYIPALEAANKIVFGGNPDELGAGYPCQDEFFKNGYWIESSNHVDAGGDHNFVDWTGGHEFSVALSAFTINVYFFNPVVNSVNTSKVSEAGGDTLILTGMGFDNSDADIEQGGSAAGSGRAGGWVDDVYEIDIIGNEGQGTTVIKSADSDFTVDSNTQITITSPALSVGTYHLRLWKDRDGTRHETRAVVSAYAGDWTAAAGGKMTEASRIVLTVGAVSEISRRWRYVDSSAVTQDLWKLTSTTSTVSGDIFLENLQTSNKIWTAKIYDDALVLHTQVEIEDKIRFLDGLGKYAGFKSGIYTSSVDYTWPVADGTNNQALCTNGSGILSWRSTGGVTGPSSSTDNAVVRFDGASGKIIQNSNCLITDAGIMFLAETANAKMTIGITINQAGNDDEVYAAKSSDVGHGFTTYTETDTFFHVNKASADGGGALIDALSDADIDAVNVNTLQLRGVTKDNGYTASGLASVSVVQAQGLYGSGTNRSAAPAGMNVWSVRTYDNSSSWVTLWVIKESGNALLKGNLGIGVDVPDAFIHVSDGGLEPGWIAGTTAIFQNNSLVSDKSRVAIISGTDTDCVLDFGDKDDQDRGAICYNQLSDFMGFRVAAGEAMRIDASRALYIGDTVNAKMTIGITVSQLGNDDEIYAAKSSDVAHGFTSYTETDTWLQFLKSHAAGGGALIGGLSDAGINTGYPTLQLRGVTKNAGYTGAGLASASLIQAQGLYGSGTSRSAAPAGMNVWSVRTYNNAGSWVTLWIIKESGNAHLRGDMTIEAGTVTLKETTTPTAVTNYGKIYTKNTNKLFFQDGAGAEHEVAFV